jgi:2-oxoglutarate dehydrogenase E1 component
LLFDVDVTQIAPFPHDVVADVLKKYSNAEIVWAQEEPRNMGAWQYVNPRLQTSNQLAEVKPFTPVYIGRPASAAPSTGYKRVHDIEQANLLKEVLNRK